MNTWTIRTVILGRPIRQHRPLTILESTCPSGDWTRRSTDYSELATELDHHRTMADCEAATAWRDQVAALIGYRAHMQTR